MDSFATSGDLFLGRPLTDDERVAAEVTLLPRASRMIRRLYRTVDARIAAGDLAAEDVSDVVCAMVQRALTRPEGVESMTDIRGPFNLTQKYSNPEGGLYLTTEERAVFAAAGTASARAFAVDLAPSSARSWDASC